jgi:NAD(P)-dependent dehydrogenase (short-subunit alcohol dehydrogenase family)
MRYTNFWNQAAAKVWAKAGARGIVLAGRKASELVKVELDIKAVTSDPNAKVLSVSVDITIESQVQNLFDKIKSTFGHLADFLLNNAGPSITAAPSTQIPFDDFTKVITGHFLGTALMTKYFVTSQLNSADPTGTIIFITSGVGRMIIPGMSSYSIAKYAGDRFTEYLDAEYPHLRAFTLSPGIPCTTLTKNSFKPFAKDHVDLP